jgi:hypothetical protein
MAASSIAPTRTARDPRHLAARASARSAPRGAGLAAVVALPVRPTAAVPDHALQPRELERPALRVVAPVGRRRTVGSRLVGLTLLAALLLGGVAAIAHLALDAPAGPAVAGHVVLQPGETLWDVAVRSAPAGVDPRRQLDTLRRLNGFGPGALDAWTVVLIPAV